MGHSSAFIADLVDLQNPAPFLPDSAGEGLSAAENRRDAVSFNYSARGTLSAEQRKNLRGENMMEETSQQERINELYRQLSPENRRRAAAFVDSLKEGEDNPLPAADSPA